jgi:hypothetical protein
MERTRRKMVPMRPPKLFGLAEEAAEEAAAAAVMRVERQASGL